MRVLSGKRAWLECVVMLRFSGIGFGLLAIQTLAEVVQRIYGQLQGQAVEGTLLNALRAVRSASDIPGAAWLCASELWRWLVSDPLGPGGIFFEGSLASLLYAGIALLAWSRVGLRIARRLIRDTRNMHV